MWRVMEMAALLPTPAYALPATAGLTSPVSLSCPETGGEAQSCAVNRAGRGGDGAPSVNPAFLGPGLQTHPSSPSSPAGTEPALQKPGLASLDTCHRLLTRPWTVHPSTHSRDNLHTYKDARRCVCLVLTEHPAGRSGGGGTEVQRAVTRKAPPR